MRLRPLKYYARLDRADAVGERFKTNLNQKTPVGLVRREFSF